MLSRSIVAGWRTYMCARLSHLRLEIEPCGLIGKSFPYVARKLDDLRIGKCSGEVGHEHMRGVAWRADALKQGVDQVVRRSSRDGALQRQTASGILRRLRVPGFVTLRASGRIDDLAHAADLPTTHSCPAFVRLLLDAHQACARRRFVIA